MSSREWREKNKDHLRKYLQEWQKKNKDKIAANQRRWYAKNKTKDNVRNAIKNRWLKRKYNITLDDYQKLLKKQNGECAICGQISSESRTLDVDHCHKSGKIRGLLCPNCNVGLGNFQDNILLLQKASLYLMEDI